MHARDNSYYYWQLCGICALTSGPKSRSAATLTIHVHVYNIACTGILRAQLLAKPLNECGVQGHSYLLAPKLSMAMKGGGKPRPTAARAANPPDAITEAATAPYPPVAPAIACIRHIRTSLGMHASGTSNHGDCQQSVINSGCSM